MSTAKEELSQLIDSLEEEDAKAVRDFVKILLAEPDEVSEDEWKEIRKARAARLCAGVMRRSAGWPGPPPNSR